MLDQIKKENFDENWDEYRQILEEKLSNFDTKNKHQSMELNFILSNLNAKLSSFVRFFKNYERYKLYPELYSEAKPQSTFELYNAPSLSNELQTEIKVLFFTSEKILSFNNYLLEEAEKLQEKFIQNLEHIEFSDYTRPLAHYLEEKPKLVSFFMSVGNGFPDESLQAVFGEFKTLHDNELNFNKYKDELYNYASVVYGLNECIKIIAYISPNLIMKGV